MHADTKSGRTLFTAGEIASLTGGGFRGDPSVRIGSVTVDSRDAAPGSLFVALPGERSDGHSYVGQAYRAGAGCVLADARRADSVLAAFPGGPGQALVLCDSPLAALQTLATEHRCRFPNLVRIGITGSSGKTTTKEIAASILGQSARIAVNPGNLNSDIGLSLSMFLIDEGQRYGVFEMGMNRAGEMDELSAILEPELGLITNIGTAHIGILGSRQAIAEEKKKMFSRFSAQGRGFVPENDDFRDFLIRGVPGRIETFGPGSTPGFGSAASLGLSGWEIGWKGRSIRFPLPGKHNLMDALGAISLCAAAGATDEDVILGLESVKPLFGRSEIIHGEVTLVRDCYNANPDSMDAALDVLDGIETTARRVYVLGSMRELGADSGTAHETLGRRAARSKADLLYFVGEETAGSARVARESGYAGILWQGKDLDELGRELSRTVKPGDLVLLKASRSIGLEKVQDYMPGLPAGQGKEGHDAS